MSELYETVSTGSEEAGEPTTQMVVEGERSETTETTEDEQSEATQTTGVSEEQRSLGAEAPTEAPAPLLDLSSSEDETPTTPERRPSPVEPLAPLPAEPSSDDEGTEGERSETTEGERSETTEATETDTESDDDRAIVRQLFVGPSDAVPLLDEERLGLRRREVGCSATPTMGPAVGGEVSDQEDLDVGDVPNELAGMDMVFADQAVVEMIRHLPPWLAALGVTVCILYLGLVIRTLQNLV
jgi:hypothetical protein